jgi:hypothetical protein
VTTLGARLEGARVSLIASTEGRYRIVRAADGADLGGVWLASDGPALVVRELCVDEAHRGYGAGSGGAALVREACAADGRWSILRAFAPTDGGLAVYFWMRMGLHPVPGAGGSGLVLERRLRR